MLVIFRCKVAGDIYMYEENAKPILDLLGKEVKQGIITAAQSGDAIVILEEEIARRKEIEAREMAERELKAREEAEKDEFLDKPKREAVEPISFAARAFPLLDMLKRANKKDKDIVWGV